MKTTVYKTIFMFQDGEWVPYYTSEGDAGVWDAVQMWSRNTDEFLDEHCRIPTANWIWVKVEVQEEKDGTFTIK